MFVRREMAYAVVTKPDGFIVRDPETLLYAVFANNKKAAKDWLMKRNPSNTWKELSREFDIVHVEVGAGAKG